MRESQTQTQEPGARLLQAAQDGSLADLIDSLAAGASPNALAPDGRNALMLALRRALDSGAYLRAPTAHGHRACVDHLLPLTDLRNADQDGETALMIAARAGLPSLIRQLAPLSPPDARNGFGATALIIASGEGGQRTTAVEELLKVANPNLQDYDGNTALHAAARAENIGSCLALMARCDPNILNRWGNNALMSALSIGALQTALALAPSSDARLANHDGETALAMAHDNSNFGPERSLRAVEAIRARLAQHERDELAKGVPPAPQRPRAGL